MNLCVKSVKLYLILMQKGVSVKRKLLENLIEWKNRKHKPLILEGARQVGKTWLMQEFGKTQYKKLLISTLTAILKCEKFLKLIWI